MNRNIMGVSKINDNEIIECTVPQGFIVRERIVDGKPVSLEYGAYITNDVFLGVPLHFNLKKNLIETNPISDNDEFKYYLVPQLMQFAVKTYKNKKTEKLNPILVEPTEENPAVFISCIAFGNNVDKILNITIDDNSLVVRKYIDKDRNCIGLILMNKDTNALNPTTRVTIDHGVIGTKTVKTSEYIFNPVDYTTGFTVEHKEDVTETPVETSFINLKNFIEVPKTNNRSKTGFKKKFNKSNSKKDLFSEKNLSNENNN